MEKENIILGGSSALSIKANTGNLFIDIYSYQLPHPVIFIFYSRVRKLYGEGRGNRRVEQILSLGESQNYPSLNRSF